MVNGKKSVYVLLFSLFLFSVNLNAGTWIASCNDGKNIQYNQIMGGSGYLYMKVLDQSGLSHTYQVARLKETFYNGWAICGTVTRNGEGTALAGSRPITQVCANKSRGVIYLKYKDPTNPAKEIETGQYCTASITIR